MPALTVVNVVVGCVWFVLAGFFFALGTKLFLKLLG